MIKEVLQFWFEEITPAQWWQKEPAFDAEIAHRFGALLAQAEAGELYHWRATAQGRLAEIILLDQFSRNIYRDTPRAFAQDGMALVLAQEAVAQGALTQLTTAEQRSFLLMPYMHSESAIVHEVAAPLFQQYASAESYEFELKHKAIVDQFGRYPHRNSVLGRESSTKELAFLQQPGSSF